MNSVLKYQSNELDLIQYILCSITDLTNRQATSHFIPLESKDMHTANNRCIEESCTYSL
jgi:hypothetical protein